MYATRWTEIGIRCRTLCGDLRGLPRKPYIRESQPNVNGSSDGAPGGGDRLDLRGYRYIRTLEDDDSHVLFLAELLEHATVCPHCSSGGTSHRHGSYTTVFDDWSHRKRRQIQIDVQRYECQDCFGTFSDELPELDPDFKATRRLVESVERQLDLRKSHVLIAVENHLSSSTIADIAKRQREQRQTIYSKTAPAETGFDEKKFLGSYRFVATNPKDRRPWELLPDTTDATIEEFFKAITNREALVVANMDFTLPIKAMVRKWFKYAAIVIDRYHVMNLLIKCLTI